MRKENQYTFVYREGYNFKIHFGDKTYIEEIAKPSDIVLSDAYPNPMRSTTTIPFTLTKDKTHVHLGIYSLQGQEIQTLVNDTFAPGFYEYEWDGKNEGGEKISSGVVIYRLQTSQPGAGVNSHFKKLIIAP
jgi:flagellar hook assembly protein FlgD